MKKFIIYTTDGEIVKIKADTCAVSPGGDFYYFFVANEQVAYVTVANAVAVVESGFVAR